MPIEYKRYCASYIRARGRWSGPVWRVVVGQGGGEGRGLPGVGVGRGWGGGGG